MDRDLNHEIFVDRAALAYQMSSYVDADQMVVASAYALHKHLAGKAGSSACGASLYVHAFSKQCYCGMKLLPGIVVLNSFECRCK